VSFASINPATGGTVRRFAPLADAELTAAIERAAASCGEWSAVSLAERAERLRAAAGLLRAGRDGFAHLMAEEMGKPLAEGRAEIDKCALVCEHYAEHGATYLADERVGAELVTYRPLGVVLAIMPWNFPFWQVFRFAAPTLMAGNAALLKHAENVLGCAEAIEALWCEAGLPDGLFRWIPIEVERVPGVLRHPAVRAVTLTGSTRAGRAVAAEAGALLKKSVLELGGSDPYVVLADADVELAARTCVTARLINGGQTCVAAKRFIAVDAVREPFVERVVAEMGARRQGDPLADEVDLGPLARADLRDALHDQVQRSIAAGASCALGGELPAGPGWFYPPTVLLDVRPGMAAFDEETFGPLAAVVPARDEDEALELANATSFGLGAAVFTRDRARGERLARERLEAGACAVNDFVRSDPRLPFGGVKDSGYGRELGAAGMRAFTNVKTVTIGG
jgi:succinate-semialdehyde dehydrogenase/glutarate-semialdehyde dehydrogenase